MPPSPSTSSHPPFRPFYSFFFHPASTLPSVLGWAADKCLHSKMTREARRACNRVNCADGADERRMVKGEERWSAWGTRRTVEVGCRLTFRTAVCQIHSVILAALQPSQREFQDANGGGRGGRVIRKDIRSKRSVSKKEAFVFLAGAVGSILPTHFMSGPTSPWQLFAIGQK